MPDRVTRENEPISQVVTTSVLDVSCSVCGRELGNKCLDDNIKNLFAFIVGPPSNLGRWESYCNEIQRREHNAE